MLCLVTGGAGFIGSHLTESLLEGGHNVRVVDVFPRGPHYHLTMLEKRFPRDRLDVVQGDLAKNCVARRSVEGVEVVFHQAALSSIPMSLEDPYESHRNNVTATLALLQASFEEGVQRVVLASSSAVYGDCRVSPIPESEVGVYPLLSPYAADKLACEHYAEVFHNAHGLSTVCLRYFNVYGPWQSIQGPVIPKFIWKALHGEELQVDGGGQSRDFVYISDVVRANLLMGLESSEVGEFNIGTGESYSLRDLLKILFEFSEEEVKVKWGSRRQGDIQDSRAEIGRMRSLGWEPRVSFRDGVRETFAHYLVRSRESGE